MGFVFLLMRTKGSPLFPKPTSQPISRSSDLFIHNESEKDRTKNSAPERELRFCCLKF